MITKKLEKNLKSEKAITLIALVITIIVLLILAGVSISMLSGDNSILNRATTARETTGQKQIEERVSLAYNAAVMEDLNNGDGKLQKNTLNTELTKLFPGSTIDIDTETDTTGKKWYVTIDNGTPIEVESGKSTPQVAMLPTAAGTTPYFPDETKFSQVTGTDLSTGLVITDSVDDEGNSTGNEYVWIEVPNANLGGEAPTFGPDYATQGLTTTKITEETITDEQKTAIETALINYVTTDLLSGSDYDYNTGRLGWKDEWYDTNGKKASNGGTTSDAGGCGLTETAYNTLYKKMLKSVYNNGGFWIGRYEAGSTAARQSGDTASGITPLSKIDQYPINWVKCSEAQLIAGNVQNKGSYNSSLMFGIQWDCVLKYLNKRGNVEIEDLTSNSERWGNYDYAYDLSQTSVHGYKGVLSLSDFDTLTWSLIESGYSHSTADWSTTAPTALSTGATTRNMKQNIYDFAGNMFEWTLEHATYADINPCADRGGYFGDTGSRYPASFRDAKFTTFSTCNRGFRVSLY